MAKRVDPEGLEIRTVSRHASFDGRDVLEIGCGDGRLALKYAHIARRVVAIDPNADSIKLARRNLPDDLSSKLEFRIGRGEELAFPAESFDLVFFTWSLCCTDIPVMGKALEEAWRVLKPKGTLINLQPSLHQPFESGALSYLIRKKFGTTVDDERYRQSRFALKYLSLIEKRFGLVAEEEFTVSTYFDTVDDALADLTRDVKELYEKLDAQRKQKIHETLRSTLTDGGILTKENAVVSVFRKGTSGAKPGSVANALDSRRAS